MICLPHSCIYLFKWNLNHDKIIILALLLLVKLWLTQLKDLFGLTVFLKTVNSALQICIYLFIFSFLKIQSSYFADVCDKLLINYMQDIFQISEIPSELNNFFSSHFKKYSLSTLQLMDHEGSCAWKLFTTNKPQVSIFNLLHGAVVICFYTMFWDKLEHIQYNDLCKKDVSLIFCKFIQNMDILLPAFHRILRSLFFIDWIPCFLIAHNSNKSINK